MMYKAKNELAPLTTANVFYATSENHYNIRTNHNDFRVPFARAVFHGTEKNSYLGPKICDIVPTELKQIQSLNSFKK